MAGLTGRVEWVLKAWLRIGRGSCDFLLASLGSNCIPTYTVLLVGAGYSRTVGKPTVARARVRGH